MDNFDEYSVEIDEDLVNTDFDLIDPYAEDKIEDEDYDDGGLLYE